jgi:hypothetical protein
VINFWIFLDTLITSKDADATKTTDSIDSKYKLKGVCLQMKSVLNICMQMKIGSNSSLLYAQTASGETQFLENESATDQNILPLDQNSAINGAVSGASVAELSIENISGAHDSFATNTPQLLASKQSHAFPCQNSRQNVISDSLGSHYSNAISNSSKLSIQTTSSADAHSVSKSSSTSTTSTTRPPACMSFECVFDVSANIHSKGK